MSIKKQEKSSWTRMVIGSIAVASLALMAACSNASSSAVETDDNETALQVAETVEQLGECTDENEGQRFKVPRDTIWDIYECEDGNWVSDFGGNSAEMAPTGAIIKGSFKDNRDGKTYKTVRIGTQTWMAENLNFDPGQGEQGNEKYDWSWCYNNDPENCAQYGRLYTWPAAMDSLGTWSTSGKGCGFSFCSPATPVRGVCPSGWHLPSKDEWDFLFQSVGGISNAARILKAQSGWDGYAGSDSYRFSSLPAGKYGGFFSSKGTDAYFWSSTEENYNFAYRMHIHTWNDFAYLGSSMKYYGFSVRCIKDVVNSSNEADEPHSGVLAMKVQATKAHRDWMASTWKKGEIVKVVNDGQVIGLLTAEASSDSTTVLTGEINATKVPDDGNELTFLLHETAFSYDNQNGLLTNGEGKSIENNYDYDYCSAAVIVDQEKKTVSVKDGLTFKNPAQAVIKITLKNKAGKPIEADQLIIIGTIPPEDGIVNSAEIWNGTFLQNVDMLTGSYSNGNIVVTPPSPTSVFYVALNDPAKYRLLLKATENGVVYYILDYYPNFWNGLNVHSGGYKEVDFVLDRARIDLSRIKKDLELQNGDDVYGTLKENVKVSIADGAQVTLSGVTISCDDSDVGWPGINCLGDATIVSQGDNSITSCGYQPGIFVPRGKKLTIEARSGVLSARGSWLGAGIGGGHLPGGDILFREGGNGEVVAVGGEFAAGIGGGNICGKIHVDDNFNKLTAKGGKYAPYSIGPGPNGSCDEVYVGKNGNGAISETPYTYSK